MSDPENRIWRLLRGSTASWTVQLRGPDTLADGPQRAEELGEPLAL